MSSNTIDFKRGDTFELGQLLSNGVALDITGYTIKSHVRYKDNLVENLTTSITDAAAGKYQSNCNSGKDCCWPIYNLTMDVEFTDTTPKVFSTGNNHDQNDQGRNDERNYDNNIIQNTNLVSNIVGNPGPAGRDGMDRLWIIVAIR